jgi:hypothetical protein
MIVALAPHRIAALLSGITLTMLDMDLALEEGRAPGSGSFWRTAVISIPGASPIAVALSTDAAGCAAIGAAMFSCPTGEVEPEMADDALAELTNVTAGEVKRALKLDQTIGLPSILRDDAVTPAWRERWSQVLLKGEVMDLVFSISTDPTMVQEYVK